MTSQPELASPSHRTDAERQGGPRSHVGQGQGPSSACPTTQHAGGKGGSSLASSSGSGPPPWAQKTLRTLQPRTLQPSSFVPPVRSPARKRGARAPAAHVAGCWSAGWGLRIPSPPTFQGLMLKHFHEAPTRGKAVQGATDHFLE